MNALLSFFVRLILGIVLGILITRLFKPEHGILYGIVTGLILTGISYLMLYYRNS